MLRLKHTFLLIGSLFFLIVSCGGGGGGGGSPAVPANSGSGGGSTPAPISGSTQAIALTFSSSSSDVELNGSVTLTWAGTNATSCDASGAWGGNNKAASGTETVNLPNIGTQTFSIVCKNSADSVTASAAVEVYQIIGGTVLDGYIRGAEVFVDRNNNLTLDSNESSVTTDNSGSFTNLRMYDGQLVAKNGTDLDTGFLFNNFTLKTKSTTDSLDYIISPVTSVGASLSNPADVNKIFGISSDIDVYSVDPIPLINDVNYATLYSIGNRLSVFAMSIQKFENSNEVTPLSKDLNSYLNIIAEEAQSFYNDSSVSAQIDDPKFVRSVLNTALGSLELLNTQGTAEDCKSNLSTMLSNTFYMLRVKDNAAATTGIQNFSFTTLQDDIVKLKTGGCPVMGDYVNNIFSYVAGDQNLALSDVTIPIQAFADVLEVNEDTELSFTQATLLANDNYLRGMAAFGSFTESANGRFLYPVDSGSFRYLPNQDFNGADTFTYSIGQAGEESTGTVTINVAPVNDNPTVISRSFLNTGGGTAVFDNVGANDIDGDALSYTIGGTDAQYISVAGNGDLSFTNAVSYASPSDGNGDNVYDFTVAVSDGGTSVTQSFQVEVTPGGSAPVFSSWSPIPTTFTENQSISIKIIASDPDGDPISLSISEPGGFSISSNANGFEVINSSGLTAGSYTLKAVITDNNSGNTTSFGIDILVKALGWQQLGPDIDGKIYQENSGKSVAMTSDGNTIAIGSPRPGTNGGIIRVYERAVDVWVLKGNELTVSGDNLDAGFSLAISATGNRLIWGAPSFNGAATNSGMAQVFEYDGSWSQLGTTFSGAYQASRMGKSVDISADGNSIIIGADEGKTDPSGSDGGGQQGLFKVFNYNRNNSTWSQVGSTIYGQAVADYDGDSVQINQDGTRIAAGAWRHDATGTDSGWVRVYELDSSGGNNEWSILGNPISFGGDTFWGVAVAMSSDGSTLAALAPGYNENGNRSGQVRVFDYANGQWMQHGNVINGEAAGDHLIETGTLALNSDGSRLIIGADLNDAGSLDTEDIGHARIFRYNSECTSSTCAEVDTWIQVGADIDGESFKDRSGSSVGISADGRKVVIGALCNDGDTGNNVDCRGHARVYEYIE